MLNYLKNLSIALIAATIGTAGAQAADKLTATATSNPSPMNLAAPCVITIKVNGDLGNDVYIFSWAGALAAQTGYSMGWNDAINDKYRMTRNADGSYSYTIEGSYQDWFKITDEQCESLTEIGVIARSTTLQTVDCMVPCEFYKIYFSGGKGTAEDPFRISTADDLAYLSSSPKYWGADNHFVQTEAIDLDGRFIPIGNEKTPFAGSYDGDGYSISGLDIVTRGTIGTGLFGVADGATISGVVIADASVSGEGATGILAGVARNSSISRSIASAGTVSSSMPGVGGLVGLNEGGSIADCYSTASIIAPAEKAVGGLVGKNTGSVACSYATGVVKADDYAGGIAGANYSTVRACVAINAAVDGNGSFIGRLGGNNNAHNLSDTNLAWAEIPHAGSWTDFADHSLRTDLRPDLQSTYQDALKWDFADTWCWRERDGVGYPELQIAKSELPSPLPDEYIGAFSAIPAVDADTISDTPADIFNLQGIFVGHSLDQLPAGFYIVRTVSRSYTILK